MLIVHAGVKVHLALGYTDMRKGMDGLAMLVQETLKKDPFSGHLFALRGKKASMLTGASSGAGDRWRPGDTGAARPDTGHTAITRRFIDNRRSSPATASISRVRRWPDGSAAPAGGSRRCMSDWLKTCLPPTICLPTTRRYRCSIPVVDVRRPDVSGSTPANNAPGVDLNRQPRSICLRRSSMDL
jgi:hypothetical protein